ncbi:hypothetical protein K470DRAFT_256947 [Piedraia hortae CBS 480.64]|uniref:Uncharacterized protein n=1 Tax=Piedraia hortae CBS 480.64 TaxID=1314780 RepID=A0A6A7C3J3_9PEZI|nr:hypothetical protein K470DRAFT_256947 [Piedraia hortae CBS 480.64]
MLTCSSVRSRFAKPSLWRGFSTLPNNPHIYAHWSDSRREYNLSLLPDASSGMPIGSCPNIPPTPDSFRENNDFLQLVQRVIGEHAVNDPDVQAQAAMYTSQAGASLGSGGLFFPGQRRHKRRGETGPKVAGGGGGSGGGGAGGASAQGGIGGAGRGGWIHVSDQRNPPDLGRVAWPEDIFGSLELDGEGRFVDGTGRYQKNDTYRVVTKEGILGLSPFLRKKLIERLTK